MQVNIILASHKQSDSKKKVRYNLDAMLKLKASVMLLERDILKLKDEFPIDAFMRYCRLQDIKRNMYFIEAMVRLSNKWMREDKNF